MPLCMFPSFPSNLVPTRRWFFDDRSWAYDQNFFGRYFFIIRWILLKNYARMFPHKQSVTVSQPSELKLFREIVHGLLALTIFANDSICRYLTGFSDIRKKNCFLKTNQKIYFVLVAVQKAGIQFYIL